MMEDMFSVMGRIVEIKKRFGLMNHPYTRQRGADFSEQVRRRLDEADAPRRDEQATVDVAAGKDMTVPEMKKLAQVYAGQKLVPPSLVDAVIQVESNYNPQAVSPKGALGLMQLMPDTVGSLGISDPFDPAENIRGGVSILQRLLQKYGGDYTKALAAYNAGERRVDESNGVPNIRETKDYVEKVINAYLKNMK